MTEVPIEASYAQAEAIRTGDLVAVADADELRARFPDWAETAIGSGVVAGVAAPFVLGREPAWGRWRWRSTGPAGSTAGNGP